MTYQSAASIPLPSSFPSDNNDGSILQAEVVFSSNNLNRTEGQFFPTEIEEDIPQTGRSRIKKRGEKDRPLLITLYVILLLSITGLLISLTRYIQVKRKYHPSPSLKEPNGNNFPVITTYTDPSQDLSVYRSDIEYILSVELSEECSKNFFEGPQKKAIDWLLYEDLVLDPTKVRAMVESRDRNDIVDGGLVPTFPLVQRYVIMVLFFGTNGELWSGRPWSEMVNATECKFMGVECNLEGEAVVLDMAFRKLRGRLPDEIGMLTKLDSASFYNNHLEGTIPSFIYNKLTNLSFLDLSRNEFTSTISSDISKLTNIKELHLNQLSLTGQVPVDAMKSLSTLEQIGVTYATDMSGPLIELSESWPNLTFFDIYQSGFTGTIPTTIGMNTNIETLWLQDVPMDFSNIPTEIGLLTSLQQFVLQSRSNSKDGATIPTELGNCQALEYLHIDGKNYTGSIPTELGRLTNMMNMKLEGGMITGSIPSEIGQLTNVSYLSFIRNKLEGTIPSELGNLKNMSHFVLYSNKLTGSIPGSICENKFISIERDCIIEKCERCYVPCRE